MEVKDTRVGQGKPVGIANRIVAKVLIYTVVLLVGLFSGYVAQNILVQISPLSGWELRITTGLIAAPFMLLMLATLETGNNKLKAVCVALGVLLLITALVVCFILQ